MEKVIQLLKTFNFTESETKVYVSLLRNHGAPYTGYEVSKQSGVPRSKVYTVLETLRSKSCIIVTKKDDTNLYAAMPIKQFLSNIQDDVEQTMVEIKSELDQYQQEIDLDQMWELKGYDAILSQCANMIKHAKSDVYIQVWYDDLPRLLSALQQAEKRLDEVIIILYNRDSHQPVDLNNIYYHGFEEVKLEENEGHRWINLVVDSTELIFGSIDNSKNAGVIWTKSKPVVFLAKENTRHDAYCLKLIDNLDDEAKEKYGAGLLGIRNIFDFPIKNS